MTARDELKRLMPNAVRSTVRRSLVHYGERTADRRPLPHFLIIGTKRGGTTSLWRYLVDHPLVPRLFPAWNTKASHYFEDEWHRGEAWYRSHFPTVRQLAALQRRYGAPGRVGEAAPLYMFHPLAAERVAGLMPQVKLIVLLRDPVERAYSHWKERRSEGTEPLSFGDALVAERNRTRGERERLIAEPGAVSQAFDWYSYRARGRYLEHLQPWLDRFDRAQLHIVASETLYRHPAACYSGVLDFLDLPPHQPPGFAAHNDRPSADMDPDVRAALTSYYRPHNDALQRRLGMSFPWS